MNKKYISEVVKEVSEHDFMASGLRSQDRMDEYFQQAEETLELIDRSLAFSGVDLREERRVLDYGSGFGRVTRYFVARYGASSVAIADTQARAVDFCKSAFGVDAYLVREPYNEMEIAGRFDLIFAGSVFTHTCAEVWGQVWELYHKLLDERGAIVFTTAGKHVVEYVENGALDGLEASVARIMTSDFHYNGYGYGNYPGATKAEARAGRCMVQPSWVHEFIEKRTNLKVRAFVERGWWGRQDLFVVTR